MDKNETLNYGDVVQVKGSIVTGVFMGYKTEIQCDLTIKTICAVLAYDLHEKPAMLYYSKEDLIKTNKSLSSQLEELRQEEEDDNTMTINDYRNLVHVHTKDFDPKDALRVINERLDSYIKESGAKKFILGISGGKDSTVVAKILADKIGKENIIGLLMPNGEQKDISDSLRVCDLLGIKHEIYNIKSVYDAEVEMLGGKDKISAEAIINIPPRIRMMTLYTYGQTHGCRVAGTGNLSERMLGYFTKWGDGASDFNILGDFTSLEVMRIGEYLGLPLDLVYKTPSDGLSGMSDEEKLGVTYIDVHNYLRYGTDTVSEVAGVKIENLIIRAGHKLMPIPIVEYRYP